MARAAGVQCWGTAAAAAFVIANEMEGGKVSPFLPRMNADDAAVEWWEWDARDGREGANQPQYALLPALTYDPLRFFSRSSFSLPLSENIQIFE